MSNAPPLVPLHPDDQLLPLKLDYFRKQTTDAIVKSLQPGQSNCLKVRPDGTIVDGHHRIKVLREHGVDVDKLPRDIVPHQPLAG